jgi:transposase
MKYVGVDLHKHLIVLCVVVLESGRPVVVRRARFQCSDTEEIRVFFQELGPFEVVVEATAAYEWFFLLIESLAHRLVLAHPKKLRVIAESTRKSDKIDAEVLASFLARDMIPQSYRPSPRIRQYRVLVRHRCWLQRRITSVKSKIRNVLGHYNADIQDLFSNHGRQHLAGIALSAADRFAITALDEQMALFQRQLREADAELRCFAETAPLAEQESRALLDTIPQVGAITRDVVLCELGDWRRFRSQKAVAAFAGLNPGFRQSGGKRLELHISKEGSRLLRWVMIQVAWRLSSRSPRFGQMRDRLERNTGSKKKAVVGVARHILGMMFAILKSNKPYEVLGVANSNQRAAMPSEPAGEPSAMSVTEPPAPARQKGAAPSRLHHRVGPCAAPEGEADGDGEGGRGSRKP